MNLEQLIARRAHLHGTDVARLFGASPWGDAHSVWLEKTGEPRLVPSNRHQLRGLEDEPLILNSYLARHTGVVELSRNESFTDGGICAATLDLYVLERGTDERYPVEAKSTTGAVWHTVPHYYWVQAQWQMHCTGATKVVFAVWFINGRGPGSRCYREYVVARDDKWITDAVSLANRWWNTYITGGAEHRPAPRGMEAVVNPTW